jgi:hypothetical protein
MRSKTKTPRSQRGVWRELSASTFLWDVEETAIKESELQNPERATGSTPVIFSATVFAPAKDLQSLYYKDFSRSRLPRFLTVLKPPEFSRRALNAFRCKLRNDFSTRKDETDTKRRSLIAKPRLVVMHYLLLIIAHATYFFQQITAL